MASRLPPGYTIFAIPYSHPDQVMTYSPQVGHRVSATEQYRIFGRRIRSEEGNTMKRFTGLAVIASGLALVWGGSMAAMADEDTLDKQAWPIITYGEIGRGDTTPLMTGSAAHANVPVRADVVVQLWPSQDTLDTLSEGGSVGLLPISATTTSDDGTFVLNLDPGLVPKDYISPDGQVDAEIRIADEDSTLTWASSMRLANDSTSQRAPRWVDANSGDGLPAGTPNLSFDLYSGEVAASSVEYSQEEAAVAAASGDPAMTASIEQRGGDFDSILSAALEAPDRAGSPSQVPCGTIKKGLHSGKSGRVLHAQGIGSIITTKVDFSSGGSHTLGIAAQSPGGVLKASGSKTISSGAGGTKSISGIRVVFNKYNYREYHSGCAGNMTYSYRPESTHSFAHYTPTASKKSYPKANCTTYYKGDSWWKNKGTNYTQSGGLNFKGVGLNVQSGWHADTKLQFIFNGKGKLCGSTSVGWVSAPLAVGDNA